MELAGHSISDACFYGCPLTNFEQLANEAGAHELDLERAKAAGLSERAIAAIAALDSSTDMETRVARIVKGIPGDQQVARPWQPDVQGLPPAATRALSGAECCKVASILLAGKDGIIKVSRS